MALSSGIAGKLKSVFGLIWLTEGVEIAYYLAI